MTEQKIDREVFESILAGVCDATVHTVRTLVNTATPEIANSPPGFSGAFAALGRVVGGLRAMLDDAVVDTNQNPQDLEAMVNDGYAAVMGYRKRKRNRGKTADA